MIKDKALVDSIYLLNKFPGKGGWTYAEIPEILQDKNAPFGWVKVRGFIDSFELKNYKLMPMGNSKLFLPVKKEIRRKIKKEAGAYVKIILYADTSLLEIPKEIIECLKNESYEIYTAFLSSTEGEKKTYLDWIYKAKTEETKVNRIVQMLQELNKQMNKT